jgi:hypothetical protein
MKKKLLPLIIITFLGISSYGQIASFTVHDIATPEMIPPTTTGANPWFIDSGPLNGMTDDYPDIVVGTYTGGTVEIYINNEDGTFAAPIVKPLSVVYGIHIADLNGDDFNDIIASSAPGGSNGKLVWYANNQDGTFADAVDLLTGLTDPSNIVTGKIDAGDTIDIALVVNGFGDDTDRVIWLANDGFGSFGSEQEIIPATAGLGPGDLDLGDADNDGDLDVVVANIDAQTVELYYNQWNPGVDDNPVSFLESGAGDISIGETYNYLFDVSFANINDDKDGDGKDILDILVVDLLSTRIAYYQNDGAGSFTYQLVNNTHENLSQAFGLDFNKDGKTDIVAVDGLNGSDNDVFWFESDNIGNFADGTPIVANPYDNQIYGFTINDFDNDNDWDLATVGFQNARLRWIENQLPPLSIDDNSLDIISIYPNPAKDKLHFRTSLNERLDIAVYDILGKEIINKSVDIDNSLDVSKLQSGLYILKFKDYNDTYKFVKQ